MPHSTILVFSFKHHELDNNQLQAGCAKHMENCAAQHCCQYIASCVDKASNVNAKSRSRTSDLQQAGAVGAASQTEAGSESTVHAAPSAAHMPCRQWINIIS